MQRCKKYLKIFQLAALHSLKNYKLLIGLSIFLVTCLLIFAHLFQLTQGKFMLVSISKESLVWYLAMNEWIIVSLPDLHYLVEEEYLSGATEYQLPRPISYIGAKLAHGMGAASINFLALAIPTVLFSLLWTGQFPFTFPQALCLFVLSYGALFVAVIFQFLVGLSAFWLQDAGPCHWIYEKFLFVFGGLMLPISAYPSILEKIALCTPAAVIMGLRSELVFSNDRALLVFFLIALWIVLGIAFAKMAYRRALKHIHLAGS